MNTPQITAAEIAAQMQKLFDASLPELLESAKRLIERTPPKRLPFMQYVHFAMAERIFILIQDVHESFMRSLETGYFTSAAITRSLMESATVLGLLSRDNNGEMYSAFLLHQEKEAAKRRDGLAELSPRATIPHIQWAAKNEAGIGERVLTALAQARTHAALPIVTMKFPNMLERCRLLGEAWEFSYHAIYRDLCEAVHGSFLKSPHSPGHAFGSPNKGDALLYDHCKVMSNALEFWAFAMLESFGDHPDSAELADFKNNVTALMLADARLTNGFPPEAKVFTIAF